MTPLYDDENPGQSTGPTNPPPPGGGGGEEEPDE